MKYDIDDTRTLLVLDEDTFGKQLHLVLCEDRNVLDHLVIGEPYANGVFRADEGLGDTLRFRLKGNVMGGCRSEPRTVAA